MKQGAKLNKETDSILENLIKRFHGLKIYDPLNTEFLKSPRIEEAEEADGQNPFAKNFLDPKNAHAAYKQAVKALKSDHKLKVTKYKGYEVVNIENNGHQTFYALKPLKNKFGAQGTISVAQEIFHDSHKNKHPNIYLCKSSTNAFTFKEFKNETKYLQLMGKLKGAVCSNDSNGNYYYQISDYVEGQDLLDACYDKDKDGNKVKNKLEPLFIIRTARGLLKALIEFYETYGVLHGDVKLANLIQNGDLISLIDFGYTRPPLATDRSFYGSPGYQANELVTYGLNQEVFSIGICFAELLTKMNYQAFIQNYMESLDKYEHWVKVVPIDRIKEAMSDVFDMPIKEGKNLRWDEELCKMIHTMTQNDHEKRPNCFELRTMCKKLKALELKLENEKAIIKEVKCDPIIFSTIEKKCSQLILNHIQSEQKCKLAS